MNTTNIPKEITHPLYQVPVTFDSFAAMLNDDNLLFYSNEFLSVAITNEKKHKGYSVTLVFTGVSPDVFLIKDIYELWNFCACFSLDVFTRIELADMHTYVDDLQKNSTREERAEVFKYLQGITTYHRS